MGASRRQRNRNHFLRAALLGSRMICALLLCSSLLLAQTTIQNSGVSVTPAIGVTNDSRAIAIISGTVLDATGAPVSGAKVRLTRGANSPVE